MGGERERRVGGLGGKGSKEKGGEEDRDRWKEGVSRRRWVGGCGGVSRTTVKWLRCYHGDNNEGTQDTLGGWRGRGLGRGRGERRESDGEEDGREIVRWRGSKYEDCRVCFFFTLRQTHYVDTHYTAMLSRK